MAVSRIDRVNHRFRARLDGLTRKRKRNTSIERRKNEDMGVEGNTSGTSLHGVSHSQKPQEASL